MSRDELPLKPRPEAPAVSGAAEAPADGSASVASESASEISVSGGEAATADDTAGDAGTRDAHPDEVEDADADDDVYELHEAEGPGLSGLYVALSFLTQLPLGPREPPAPGALARAMGMFPLVGVVVGGIGAATYVLAHQVLPASVAALLAVAATMLATGGLHEDGLADTADGFGGGGDRDRKLAIMRDSRIGTFGVLAVVTGLGLRAACLAEIGGSLPVAGALVAAHALARAAIPVAMQALAPARADGLGAAAGQPGPAQTGVAITLAVIVAGLALPASAALAALAGATIGCIVVVALAEAQIGGHTGDVLGAVEQSAETLALIGALAAI